MTGIEIHQKNMTTAVKIDSSIKIFRINVILDLWCIVCQDLQESEMSASSFYNLNSKHVLVNKIK